DARRKEVFAAPFAAPDGPQLEPATVLAPGLVAELVSGPVPAVGDGAVRYRAELEAAGLEVPPDEAPEHLLRASAVCELGLAGEPAADYQLVVPDYLRRPDAELTLRAAR